TSTSNLTSLPIPFAALTFGKTYFWKCLYTDTNGHPSLESAETSFIYGTDTPLMPGTIVLNEIMADNRSAVSRGRAHPDYIELFNNSQQPQSLNGFSLSDNTALPGKYIFPPITIILPFSYLVVWCDSDTNAPGLHTGFALDNDGQTVALFTVTTNGFALSDALTFGLQTADFSIGRFPDGSGPWLLTAATPGDENDTASRAAPNALPIDPVPVGPQVVGVSQGRLPDGAATIVSFPKSASPEDPNYLPLQSVVINEVLSHSDPPLEVAVELFNPTATAVDISGWW